MGPAIISWDYFTEKFPVKVRSIEGNADMEVVNRFLERDIRDSGQGALSAAKCYRTHWKMHRHYDSFVLLNNAVLDFAKKFPLATHTDEEGTPKEIPLKVLESWGLIYSKGSSTDLHSHWPALWSYCYCVKACKKCVPLYFPTLDGDREVPHKTGQIILWPAWISHEVYKQECDHDRIVVSGNIYTDL